MGWWPPQIGVVRYAMLVTMVLAQIATLIITWELWQFRSSDATFPNLPWFGSPPQFDYALLLIASLVGLLVWPGRWGWSIHLVILAAAIGSDQIRCQPQILSPLLLINACLFPKTKSISVWFLIAMWSWAGIHKLLSPDWTGEVTYYMLLRDAFAWGNFHLWDYHHLIALMIGLGEITLALVAWKRPQTAAPICFSMHLGIAVFLILIDWNFSVLPWNICTAIVGTWLLWTTGPPKTPIGFPSSWQGRAVVALLLLTPVGFYFGWMRHSLCHVLYSANFPDAVITSQNGPLICWAIEELRVPFPHERKSYLDLFELTGDPGDTLHIKEYRPGLMGDEYFVLTPQHTAQSITRQQFFDTAIKTTDAIAFDDRRNLFQLDKLFHQSNSKLNVDDSKIGRVLKRDANAMAWAIQFSPSAYERRWLALVAGLPNLEQIQLSGCDVTDDDLQSVSHLTRLKGIGLQGTSVTDAGLLHLRDLPDLNYIDHEQTRITPSAVQDLLSLGSGD